MMGKQMVFRGSHSRRHHRYAYLQFITFFSLGPQVAEGSRRAICVDLSDSGLCMYTPSRLHKGQVILFNNPLPVEGPKATVRWVKEYRITGPFCKSGIMFSNSAQENSPRSSRSEHQNPEGPSPEGVEKRSSLIENDNFTFPGGNYPVASSDDFWSDLAELSEEEAEQFIALTSEVMLHETMKADQSLRFLRAVASFRKARLVFVRKGTWDDSTLDLLEKSLIDFRAADEFSGNGKPFPHAALEENRDAAAKALEGKRPGRAQEILGKTKLAYVGNRLFVRSPQHAPSDAEMSIFGNIFFRYPDIVRSAEIFYKALGEPGRRHINVLLYKETSPRNSAGEANTPLCIIGLVEDGTFHLVKDLVAEAANTEDGQEGTEAGSRPYEEQSSLQTAAGERTDREAYENPDKKKRSPEASGGIAGRAGGKPVKILIACAAVLLLVMITLFFLKSYRPKSVLESGNQATSGVHQTPTQQTTGLMPLLSEPPENRPAVTGEPESSGKAKRGDSRGAPAGKVTVKKGKRPRETETNAEGRIITKHGRATKTLSPGKRSFPPHSRDDL
jgi:hypothetical protein